MSDDKKSKLPLAKVKAEASGKWVAIFQDLRIHDLDVAMKRIGSHCGCPVHGGDDGFRLFKDFRKTGGGVCNTCGFFPDGFEMLQWLNNWDLSTAIEQVAGVLGLSEEALEQIPVRKPQIPEPKLTPEESLRIRDKLEQTWFEGLPLDHPDAVAAQRYLLKRRLGLTWYKMYATESDRFHPALPFYLPNSKRPLGKFPAIISMVRTPAGKPVTIHRTFLTEDGDPLSEKFKNIPKFDGKKIMEYREDIDSLKGSAVRYGRASRIMGVSEGKETSGSASHIFGIPVWSCNNAWGMENFVIPDVVELLLIFGDLDRSGRGQEAADRLKAIAKEQGKIAEILYPPMAIPESKKGVDWNDFWRADDKSALHQVEQQILRIKKLYPRLAA